MLTAVPASGKTWVDIIMGAQGSGPSSTSGAMLVLIDTQISQCYNQKVSVFTWRFLLNAL